jgi:hypothetical protein
MIMDLHQSWAQTSRYLKAAQALLPPITLEDPEIGTLARLNEWLDHNELELALDELVGLGELNQAGAPYWQKLLAAAEKMGLTRQSAILQAKITQQDGSRAQALIERIYQDCTGATGFLVELHVHGIFDQEKYQRIVRHISDYKAILGQSELISRKVASCLFALQEELTNQITTLNKHVPNVKQSQILDAHAEVLQLVYEIFDV